MSPRPMSARVAMDFSGALSSQTLATSGLAYCGSLNVVAAATIGASLVVTGPITASSFSGVGSSLTALNASNITSGTVPVSRLGSAGTTDATTFLRGDNSWSTAVTRVTVASANGISASVATQGTTPVLTFALGAITPTSVAAAGNIGGATLSSSGLATLSSLAVTGNAAVGGTLGVTGNVTAPAHVGALIATAALSPSLTTGVYAGLNSAVSTIPQFGMITTAAPANARASSLYVDPSSGTLNWALLADDLTTNSSFMTVARNANTATTITLTGTSISLNGVVSATGGFNGSGANLTALNAAQLSSGTVPVARLGSAGTPGTTTFLRGDNNWQTAVTSVSVVTANGVSATVATQGTTPALTFTLGAITPSSVNATGSVTASAFVGGSGSYTTITTSGLATLNSASVTGSLGVGGSATVGGSLSVTGAAVFSNTVTVDTLIPTGNVVPTYGLYEGGAGGGVAIATNSTARWGVSAGGTITQSAPLVEAPTVVSASAVDCSKGNYFTKTYTGSLTWTFTNVPTGGLYRFVLRLTRGSAGTQTWPSTVKWTGGAAPTLTSTTGGNDFLEFWTDDGGTTWRAFRSITTTS